MPARRFAGRTAVLLPLTLGLALRAYHYLRGRAVWGDEAALLINALDNDFLALLGPLRFHEAGPPLFLWLMRAVGLTLGGEPLPMRLPAFLAGCASLVLLVVIARRLLPPAGAFWAVLLFGCSETLLWHACEAKPYAVDVLIGALVPALYLGVGREAPCRALLGFGALAPLLIWLSYPACFLLGGVLLALLPAALRGPGRVRLCYGVLVVAVGGSFLALLLGPITAQHDPTIHSDWTHCMPDWQRPWAAPGWVLLSTLEVFRYCCKPLGQPLALLAVVGGVWLRRTRRGDWLVLLAAPLALALLAACLHSYPYGGVRVVVYAAPGLALLIGAGVPVTLGWLRARVLRAALVALLLLPAWQALRGVVFAWDEADVAGAAAYVEARREPGDPVVGNDWTHLYYLRHLDPPVHWAGPPLPAFRERVWVVFTDDRRSPEERLAVAAHLAPSGWELVDRGEFRHTTVALFARSLTRDRPHTDRPARWRR
jgi:hypothetical protein